MTILSNLLTGAMFGLNLLLFLYSIKEIILSKRNLPLILYTGMNLVLNIRLFLMLVGG